MKKLLTPLLLCCIALSSFAIKKDSLKRYEKFLPQEYSINGTTYSYGRPKMFSFIKNVPKDLADFGKSTWKKESILPISSALASTALLFYYDEEITAESQLFATRLGIENENNFKNVSKMSMFHGDKNVNLPLFLPENFPTSMYFLGDGMTSLLFCGSLYGYGLIAKDNRALTTSSEVTGMLISMGIVTQSIKRITGRTSPAVSTSPRGGHWKFFPPFLEYSKNTPYYDAMPSGHFATAMATLTIFADNYAEKKWIRPVGYTFLGLMSFQMVHTKVHWVSDYPFAFLIGYVMGKNAVKRGRKIIKKHTDFQTFQHTPFWKKINITPFIYGNIKGAGLSYRF